MKKFLVGILVARMAEIIVKRRQPDETALHLIHEMFNDIPLKRLDFPNGYDLPGHALGDLVAEAFAPGEDWSALQRAKEDPEAYDNALERWGEVWDRFEIHLGIRT